MTRSTTAACVLAVGLAAPLRVLADQPGRGLTAPFKVDLMKLVIDHHFAAMRMTELAAGTDPQRDAAVAPTEGTSPTPGFGATQANASLDDLKSLARRNNRMQREEIATLQTYLREWYGIAHEPQVRPDGAQLIRVLAQSGRSEAFDHAFFEVFSRHHYTLLQPLNGCLTGSELTHDELRRLCSQAWHSQTEDIEEMRQELERSFSISDYRPFPDDQPLDPMRGPPRGEHSGGQPLGAAPADRGDGSGEAVKRPPGPAGGKAARPPEGDRTLGAGRGYRP